MLPGDRYRRIALCFAIAAVAAVLVGTTTAPPRQGPAALRVTIQDGQFNAAENDSGRISVAANVSLQLTLESLDYLYVVEERQLNRTVIVHPRTAVPLQLELPPGVWSFEMVQGCGRLFQRHEETLVLEARP